MSNQLTNIYSGPLGSIEFSKFSIEDYKPTFTAAIEKARDEINAIKNDERPADFKNTIIAYEKAGSELGAISSLFFNLNSAETSDEMQALAQEISPLLTAYSSEIQLDEVLFNRIQSAYKHSKNVELDAESRYLVEKIYRGFVRHGANLNEADKAALTEIQSRLAQLTLKFSENVLKDSNQFELWIENENDLNGLPDSDKEAAQQMAAAKGKPNAWLITLDFPSYIPFMKYAANRALREQLFRGFGSRAFNDNDYNNGEILKEISALRLKKAQLLGYSSHANYVLEERMAKKPKNVIELWDELLTIALPKAKEELSEVQDLANKLGGPNPMERWDFSFYAEKLKDEKYALNDEILKPYFKLENVIDGAFKTAEKLFQLRFVERNDFEKYHQEVRTYEVFDRNNASIAVFYADFFPRPGKRNGAWMTSYRGQNKYDGVRQNPIVSIVCNFTKPTSTKPSLLTFGEVTTLFHEFGHALHGLLADGTYESLSGTSVFWDFVELPSQLMENWCYEPACLELFAKHFETNEVIPVELIDKIKASMNFLSAYQTVRQVSLGQLDMAWHNIESPITENIEMFERSTGAKTELFPEVAGIATSSSFSHIFSGGYSAGYYSYKWAEVLEADAFEYFKENGVFNTTIAKSYCENILSKGGSADPMELYIAFRGKKPSTAPLLKKSGLL